MLRTTKSMKEKYEQIQNCLFDIIPEKWEDIYLYASVIDIKGKLTGELYFYYLPKGILKKKLINVYEVPSRFNIDEDQYMTLVERLYEAIKSLRQDFVDTDQKIWTNLTIVISNCKFRVEYNYDTVKLNEYDTYRRHIIWKYKYLGLGGDLKDERKILDKYFSREYMLEPKKEIYESGIYVKKVNNIIDFDKEDKSIEEQEEPEIIEKNQNENEEVPKKRTRNQILND